MKNPTQFANATKSIRTLSAQAVGRLQPIALMLARPLVLPLLFLGAGLMLAQPCAGAPFPSETAGSTASDYLTSTELYDSGSGTWRRAGDMGTARANHTATLLPSGLVLVAGGLAGGGRLTSAELYDPSTGTWSATGSLNVSRSSHTATLLPDGRVLVVGGAGVQGEGRSAELYDPARGIWRVTKSLHFARGAHTATLLSNGMVLVAGALQVRPLRNCTTR